MRTKVNFDEIEKRLDFEALSKNLDTLTESGALKRKKTVHDLLDKMKPALLRARENKVSLEALTEFLVTSGIPITEPTLRLYLSSGKSKKKRPSSDKRVSASSTKPAETPQESVALAPSTSSETQNKKVPPRLARR